MSRAGINDFPNASLADVAAALPVLRAADAPLLVHAELAEGPPPRGDPRSHATWAASRPPAWERAAVSGLLEALRLVIPNPNPDHSDIRAPEISKSGEGRGYDGAGSESGAVSKRDQRARGPHGGFGLHIAHVADAGVVDMLDAARAGGAGCTLPSPPRDIRMQVGPEGAGRTTAADRTQASHSPWSSHPLLAHMKAQSLPSNV